MNLYFRHLMNGTSELRNSDCRKYEFISICVSYLYTCIVVNLYKLFYKPSIRRRSDSDTGFFSR